MDKPKYCSGGRGEEVTIPSELLGKPRGIMFIILAEHFLFFFLSLS